MQKGISFFLQIDSPLKHWWIEIINVYELFDYP
jgi:hypothetical protein